MLLMLDYSRCISDGTPELNTGRHAFSSLYVGASAVPIGYGVQGAHTRET